MKLYFLPVRVPPGRVCGLDEKSWSMVTNLEPGLEFHNEMKNWITVILQIIPCMYLVFLTYSKAIMLIVFWQHYRIYRRDILISILVNVEPGAKRLFAKSQVAKWWQIRTRSYFSWFLSHILPDFLLYTLSSPLHEILPPQIYSLWKS